MTMTIKTLSLIALTALAFTGFNVQARELDNQTSTEQAARAKDLPATVVVRIDEKTGEASVLETSKALSTDEAGAQAVEGLKGEFKAVSSAGRQELDRTSSTSSWYVSYNYSYYYAPTYYYYAYSYVYQPCYSYVSYGYRYIWYRWW